jgi:cytochrome b561
MARVTGWMAVACIVLAALVPVLYQVRLKKRAAPASGTIKTHVILGLVTSAVAFGHTFMVLPALGEPAAIGGGMLALIPAGAAFCFLVAHAGIGLQLRNEKLKDRVRKRRTHVLTASLIALAVGIHVYALLRA